MSDQRSKSTTIILLVMLALVLLAAVFFLHTMTGPWTKTGKTKAAFNKDLGDALSDLGGSYGDTRLVIRSVVEALQKQGDTSNKRFNEVLRRLGESNTEKYMALALRAEDAIGRASGEIDQLYRTHNVTEDQLRKFDKIKAQSARNYNFLTQFVTGTVDADALINWTDEADGFYSESVRIKTDFDLHQ